jgi:prepilin-type processing-associated H-X9-DG protein
LNRFLWSIFRGTPSNSPEHNNEHAKKRNIYEAFEAYTRLDLSPGVVMKKLIAVLCIIFFLARVVHAESADSPQPPGDGEGVLFDGSPRQVAVGGNSAISGTFTVEAWVRPDDTGGVLGIIGSRCNPNEYGFDLKIDVGGKIHADIGNGTDWAATPANADITCSPGSWVYIAYVVTPTNYTVYVNGKKAGSGKYDQTNPVLRDASHSLFIGWTGFGTEYFKGKIGLVRTWNMALRPRQIARIWNQELQLPRQNLALCYRFDDSDGSTIHDATGNGNDGTLVNGISLADSTAPMLRVADGLTVNQISYDGQLSNDEARFSLDIKATAANKGESSAPLLQGNVAILPSKLPDNLKIVRNGGYYILVASRPGQYKFKLNVVAKIQRNEPWNRVSFTGPAATIASVSAYSHGMDTVIQLLNGTPLDYARTNGISELNGFLGADQTVALRWQTRVTEVAHKALLTVDSAIAAQFTPTVIKYTSQFHYNIVQGHATELTLSLPAAQTLTHIQGDQIRDWQLTLEGDHQRLTVELIKPQDNNYVLTLSSEQSVENPSTTSLLDAPQPLNVEHESGSLVISADSILLDITPPATLRQVNAPDNALAAYEFDARPLMLSLKLNPIEPVINVADRVNARLEEARLVVSHQLTLNVAKAGVYNIELTPQPGFAVADVRGDGIQDWNMINGKIHVDFFNRILGSSEINVQLEEPLKTFPDKISVAPLDITGAASESAQIGASAAPGIRLSTGVISGLREISVDGLSNRSNETLAYSAAQPGWNLSIATEHLAARVVADVFNLVTIGDGIAGGSATIRYGLVNQGVQEFKVHVPSNLKNVEFTGPNIRSKEFTNDVWTIGLQDKAWDGYTLVVTYDYQFDPTGTILPVAGIHALNVERETGSIAITTAANLQINPDTVSDSLRRIDESELSAAARPFIARAVLLAYQYTGDKYDLGVDVKRFAEEPVLEAVADRTQITSVLTDSGQMLTDASFMVKNNEKQFQRFELPPNAILWGCYVNGQPAKPQRDDDWVLVPLAHDSDRDQAFAVDIMYAQTNGALASTFGKSLALDAPRTDVPNTYAEWRLFVPPKFRLSNFGGSMNVAEGTTYGWLDAWGKFLAFYGMVLREAGNEISIIGLLAFFVIAFVISAVRRGWNGVITLFIVVMILGVLAAMLLPVLSSAKRRAQRINSISELSQIGVVAQIFAGDNTNRLPASLDEMKGELGSTQFMYDVASGQQFVYLGGGMSLDSLSPGSVLAYSPMVDGRCNVLYADGSVAEINAQDFQNLSQRGLVQLAAWNQNAEAQNEALTRAQFSRSLKQEISPAAANGTYPIASPAPTLPAAHAFAGGFGGFSGVTVANGLATTFGLSPPVAAGVRSIHIELPQTGQPFVFTKVLNIGDVPLSIRARVMPLTMYQAFQMVWQIAVFVIGMAVWWVYWHRAKRNTFILTLALAMIIGSVCSLLVQWRALHDVLIVGFPIVTLAMIAFLIWKYWPRHHRIEPRVAQTAPEPPPIMGGIPPVTATIALLCALSLTAAKAADISALDSRSGSINSASYSATINNRVASVDALLEFSPDRKRLIVPLFSGDVAVQQFTVKRGKAQLVRDGNNLEVMLNSGDKVTLEITMLVKIKGDVTKRELAFGIPPALSSQASFVLDQPDADVDLPSAVSFKRILQSNKTCVDAVMGSAANVDLVWTPRTKQAAEVATTVFCQNAGLVTFGGGVVNVRSTMDYQITQGEMREARVQLPAGQRLLRVQGVGIRTWEIQATNGAQTLVVDLLEGATSSWRLTIEMEKNLDTLPGSVAIDMPHTLGVKRETGFIALRQTDSLALSVENSSGLERVDSQEFPGSDSKNANDLSSVFQFSKPEFVLRTRVEAIQPEIEAVAVNKFRIGSEQVSLSSRIDYTIKHAGVFALELALPDGYRVESVDGNNIEQQTERVQNSSRILEVILKEHTIGAYNLDVQLTRDFKQLPKSLSLAGVEPRGVARLTGFIFLAGEPGVAINAQSFDGLLEIPVASLPANANVTNAGGVLAYKFISSESGSPAPWNLSITTDKVAAWVRAEIVNTVSLTETLANGRTQVRYEIANAPVKELRVNVPGNFQNVQIIGPNIRSREQDGNIWRVELQSPIQGTYILTVTWEQPVSWQTNAMQFTGVSAEGVERETGLLAISAKAPLQVNESITENLQRVDSSDFPDWAGSPDSDTALAYRYVRPGYKLSLDVRRLNDAEVLQAIVENADITSVVADDGQAMTEMKLSLQSNGRQFLEIALPAGATVWSAFVAGQPVQPGLRDGKVLLPIQQSAASDSSTSVELTYVGTNAFPRSHGQIGFTSPQFDVPLKNARWEVYLPPDYNYKNFQGTMTREIITASEVASKSFSSLDYSLMEQNKKTANRIEVLSDLSNARRELENGDTRGANADLDFARNTLGARDLDKWNADSLEKDLRKAQASNLIAAQNDFSTRNGIVTGEENAPNLPHESASQYNDDAAQDQWTKLQQAQEITAAKIQPLHINLPVRGAHYAFTQVLQTETGKPMTIELFAANSKSVNWPLRATSITGAFLLLWTLVVSLSRLSRHAKTA